MSPRLIMALVLALLSATASAAERYWPPITETPTQLSTPGRFVWADGAPRFGFGKHNGRPLRDVARTDRDYFSWLLSKDFEPDVK